MPHISRSLATLPAFGIYMVLALGLTVLFALIYTRITPHCEWKLMRAGNLSASLAFGGSLLGFALPLASAIAHSESLLDCALWGLVALVVQILAFFGIRMLLPEVSKHIEEDMPGPAVALAMFSLTTGLLNAACMTW